MKITFISDTHNQLRLIVDDIPPCDVLVHCGDMLSRGNYFELEQFAEDIEFLNKRGDIGHIVGIAGNHDWGFERHRESAEGMMPDCYKYLEDSEIIIDGVKFYGSPVTPRFCDWAFNVDRGKAIAEYWDRIPEDTDVLITHGPPRNILDISHYDKLAVGCDDLMIRVLEVKPRIHAFGHIHDNHGIEERDGIIFINASNLSDQYIYKYKPITVEI